MKYIVYLMVLCGFLTMMATSCAYRSRSNPELSQPCWQSKDTIEAYKGEVFDIVDDNDLNVGDVYHIKYVRVIL